MRCRPGDRTRIARRSTLALVALLAASGIAGARPVEQLLGRPVTSIRLELEGRETHDAALVDLLETRVGRLLTMADVRETIAHLYGLGRFQDIQVDASASPGGVALVYQLVPLHAVGRILFRGQLGLPEGAVRSEVADRYGTSPAVGRAGDIARTLTAMYRERGYFNASVTPRAEVEHAPERTTLVFEIEAGEPARIGSIEIAGESAMPRARLLDRLGLRSGERYDRSEVLAGLAKYADELRSRGYYEVQADHTARVSADGRTADLVVTLVPGPEIQVAFEGDPLPAKQRDELVPIRREGSIDEDLLEDAKRAIEAHLRGQGYRDPTAEYSTTGDDRQRRVVFRIKKGMRYKLTGVEIAGNSAIPPADLEPLLRVEPGEPFVQSALDADVGRIAEQYRRRGFAAADVTAVSSAGVVLQGGEVAVVAQIQIVEGPRTLIRSVSFQGNSAVGSDVLKGAIGSQPEQPFYQAQLANDRDGIELQYLNRGYRNATAEASVAFSEDRTRADVRFVVHEGAQVFVDHILIVGNIRTSNTTIERELTLERGKPLGLADVVESQRRVAALGLFRRVRIVELDHAGSLTHRDLLVSVEEAPLTTIGYGGGLEGSRRLREAEDGGAATEVLEFSPRGFFEVGRRNLWGKNRSVNLFTRVSLRRHQTTDPTDNTQANVSGYGFNEYRVLGAYREPKVFGTAADALVTGLLEQAIRSSFSFSRQAARAEAARRLTAATSVAGRYSFERVRLFDERIDPSDQPDIDRLFPQVRLSLFSTTLIRDTRDDALDPAVGHFVTAENAIAARAIGSEVGFAKAFVQGFVYRRLPGRRRVIFAGGARFGVATGFPRTVTIEDPKGNPVLDADGNPVTTVVKDIPASERFFAGGDTTVRGFALDRLGTPDTFDENGFPKGGHALVIFNAEIRVPIWRDLGAVGFLDAGNVFAGVDDLDLTAIRGTSGFGVRYRSPIGPVRIDVGFKFDRQMFANGQLEPRTALHISLGQAF